jgi:hypothetical protein
MSELLLDACVLINLAATGVPLVEFAERNEMTFHMASVAAAEVLYLIDDRGHLETIDVDAYVDDGVIHLALLTEAEQEQFIRFARDLDDGEAATLAVATARGWRVATDDRKARRLAGTLQPPLELVTTSALLHGWTANRSEPSPHVAAVLQRIELRASFAPPRDDPLREWWVSNSSAP